jgi:hypothetical protein
MKTLLIYAASWLGMVILAILNGAVRDSVYGRRMSKLSAHQLSTLTGIILIGVYIWFLTGMHPLSSPGQALLVGGMWLVMTIAFEFIFGHYVMGHAWSRLFEDYNLLKGKVWLFVPLWTAMAPYVFFCIRS